MDKLPAASSAMQWSIDLDRALRSRHPATRLRAVDAAAPRLRDLGASPPAAVPPAVASALGVLPSEPRLFAHTILLRLAAHFATADNAVRARILRALLLGLDGSLPLPMACVAAEPQQQQQVVVVLARVKAAYDAGCPRARALALRMFGCLAHLAHHSLHLRSLILSTFYSSNAPQVKAALFAAACFSRLSVDFSYITLEALRRLISSPTSQPQVGKQIVLGTLEDNFKADMLLSLSRLASKSVVLFGDQVELLLLFLEHESSHCMKTVSLKCLCFMFHGSICHFPVLRTVFGTLLQLIDDDDFPLDCKRDAFMVLQKIVCGKAPIVHFVNTCELSKLVLAAESSLHSSSWEMQGIALKVIAGTLCFLQQTRSHQNMITQEGSSLTYNGCQGITSNFLSTHVEIAEDKLVHKIVTSMMYRSMLSSMLKLLVCYPSAAAVALDKLRCLIKELARLDDSDCSEVSVANVESFQTNSACEVLDTSNDIVKPVSASMKVSHMGTDFDKLKFDPTEFSSKKEVPIEHNMILWTLKFANSCHNVLSKTPGASCNLYDSIKELIECVQQNTSQYCSTYESFHLIMCACISWYACKTRDVNQESGDSKEQPDIFFSPSVWLTQELCAIRITKMLFRNQRYWDAYRSAMYCCREGLWFAASSVFRKLADDFGSGSFSFWFKSLLLISAGEIEMKLLLFPSAIIKLVNELKTDCDLHENFYWVETNVDSSLADSSELHGSQAKITDICSRTFLATDPLLSNTSSSHELFFQRWLISLRASFLEILADFLGILTAHLTDQRDESHHDAIGDHSSVPREHNNSQLLALANLNWHKVMICLLYPMGTWITKVHSSVEPCRLPEKFSHASVVQDLHERVDKTDSQIVSQLQQLMPICCDEVHSVQIVTRMNCSGILEKDSYRHCKFAVAYLLRLRGDTRGIATGEDSVSPLHGGMQFLSNILQRVMELPFVLPKYFFRVRPCFGAELHLYDSNPENRDGISVPSGFQLSLTLCLQWKCVLERSDIDISKLYCVLAASSASSCLDVTGTRSKEFEIRKKTAGMVVLNTKLMQYIQDDLRKQREKKRKKVHVEEKDMVTAFACFEASDSGMGFSSCLLDVSEFPQGSYKMKWHACCIDKDGAYYSLLPLNDGAAFSVGKS
uniref:Integrator complex subunit 7-like C-terminal domain-containing protein n=1 Tax=Oryza meridionalis TaxID=40149 RepID=A0A0E0BYG4_9ORYZ